MYKHTGHTCAEELVKIKRGTKGDSRKRKVCAFLFSSLSTSAVSSPNHSFTAAYSRYVYLPAHHGIPIKDGFHSPTRAMTNLSLGSWQAVNVYGSLLILSSRRR